MNKDWSRNRTADGRAWKQIFCECGCKQLVNANRRFAEGHGEHKKIVHCECGCGEVIPWKPHFKYKRPRFIRSHHARKVNHTVKPPEGWKPPSGQCECGCGQATQIASITNRNRNIYKGYPNRFVRGHSWVTATEPNNRDGRQLSGPDGYWMVRSVGNPMANERHYVFEHRLVMSTLIGRPLLRQEVVHHKNGVRQDNRPENLELWSKSHPAGQRARDLLVWAKEIIALYDGKLPEGV